MGRAGAGRLGTASVDTRGTTAPGPTWTLGRARDTQGKHWDRLGQAGTGWHRLAQAGGRLGGTSVPVCHRMLRRAHSRLCWYQRDEVCNKGWGKT